MITDSKVLTIDEILAADDTEFVEVDAWGGKVRFGTLDAGTMIEFASKNEGPAKKTAGVRLLVDSLVDSAGNRIGRAGHYKLFEKKSAAVINRLCEVLLELNGMKDKALDFSTAFQTAGTDRDALAVVLARMKGATAALESALAEETVDPKKIKRIAEGESLEDVEKNDSGETT